MRCLDDGREGLKHKRRCGYRKELDVMTLVCTRGRDFPLIKATVSELRVQGGGGDVQFTADE